MKFIYFMYICFFLAATKNDTPTPEVITDSIVSAENYKTYGNIHRL